MRLFVDVDDTLILYHTEEEPNPYGVYLGTPYSFNTRLVQGILNFAAENPESLIVVWSGGGQQYAREWADKAGLEDKVVCFDKNRHNIEELVREGDVVVDDQTQLNWVTHGPHDWPEHFPTYFLKADWETDYREVTEDQFVTAERQAGFYPKPGCGPVATSGFSGHGVSGQVRYR